MSGIRFGKSCVEANSAIFIRPWLRKIQLKHSQSGTDGSGVAPLHLATCACLDQRNLHEHYVEQFFEIERILMDLRTWELCCLEHSSNK